MKMLLRRRARPARTWRLPLRAAIVVEGGNSDQAGDLFAADAAQFGQADDQRQRGAQADALDGYEQVKPARQRGVPGKRGGRQRHVGITAPFETGDIALVQALEPRHPRRLGHRLQHHDLLLELLQVGQFGIEGIEAGVRQRRQLIETGREGGDQCRIEPVVLGVLEPAPGEGAHLRRLQPRRRYRPATQMRKQQPFVAARRLEADAGHALPGHKGIEMLEPDRVISDAQMRPAGMDGDVEPGFRHIDPGADHAMMDHLPCPCLGYEPKRSCNHTGPVKRPVAILLPTVQKAKEVSIRQPAAGRALTRPANPNLYENSESSKRWLAKQDGEGGLRSLLT